MNHFIENYLLPIIETMQQRLSGPMIQNNTCSDIFGDVFVKDYLTVKVRPKIAPGNEVRGWSS